MGSLFKESFERKVVSDEDYLRTLICYIHNNPVHHGLSEFPLHWKFSSYHDLFNNEQTFINKEILIGIFETLENLVFVHEQYRNSAMLTDE